MQALTSRGVANKAPSLALAGIVALHVALQCTYFMGLALADPFAYAELANDLLQGEYPFSSQSYIYRFRLGIIGPTAAAYWAFGVNEVASVLWPVTTSSLLIVVTYLVGKELVSPPVGLLAALLVSLNALLFTTAQTLLPDVPLALFLTLAVYLFLLGERRELCRYSVLAGLSLAAAFFVKVSAVLGLAFIFTFLLVKRRIRIRHVCLLAAFGAPIALVYLWYRLETGDFFLHLHVLERIHRADPKARDLFGYTRSMWTSFPTGAPFGHYPLCTLLSALYLSRTRSRPGYLFAAWFLGFYALSELAPGSSSFVKAPRYLCYLVPPMALLIATAVLDWRNRSASDKRLVRNLPLLVATPLLLFPSLEFIRNETLYRKQRLGRYRRVHALIDASEPKDIYTPHFRWPLRLRYYFQYRYPRKMYQYGGTPPPQPSDAYFVFDRSFFGPDSESSALLKPDELPAYALTPPEDWVPLLRFEDERTGHPVEVYRVPRQQ